MKQVIVYTMNYCPYCERAKALLKQRGIHFKEIKVADDDDAMWDKLYVVSKMKTMPQIYFSENAQETEIEKLNLVGGYQDLAALDKKDSLESLK